MAGPGPPPPPLLLLAVALLLPSIALASESLTLHNFRLAPESGSGTRPAIRPDPASLALGLTRPAHSHSSSLEARLDRDQQRVNAILARVATPSSAAADSGGGFRGRVVSGLPSGSGEYFVTLGVGSPPVQTSLAIDTGSDLLWLQCAPCQDCYNQDGPIFDPHRSASYRTVGCGARQCQLLDERGCSGTSCLYEVDYGDGSFTEGELSTETLTLTSQAGKNFAVQNVALGCGHDDEGLFVGAAGLLGLGRGALSFPSQLQATLGTVFSYCLVDRDSLASSSLSFGHSAIPQGTLFTPLLTNARVRTFYYVGLEGISVGGAAAAIPAGAFSIGASGAGGVVIDSGTSVTRLTAAAYNATRDLFVSQAAPYLGQPAGSFAIFDTCFDLSQRQSVQVPELSLRFHGGVELPLPARNYLLQVDDSGTVCFALAPTPGSLSIIGNIQQMGTRVVYDAAGGRIGFARNQC